MTVQAPAQGQATEAQPSAGLIEPSNVEGQKTPSLVDLFPAASPHDIDWNPVSQDIGLKGDEPWQGVVAKSHNLASLVLQGKSLASSLGILQYQGSLLETQAVAMRSMTALEFKMYSAWLNGAAPPDLPGDPAVLQAELSNTTTPGPDLLFSEPTNFSPDDESRLLALSQLYDLGPNDRVDQFDMNNMLSMDHLRYFEAKFPQLQPLILAHCRVLLQYSMQELNHEVYTERVRAECHALRTQLALLDYRIQEHVRQNAQTLQIASANGQLLRNRLQQLTHLLEGGTGASVAQPRAIQQHSTQAQSGDSSNKRKANEAATPAEEEDTGESSRSVRPRHEDEAEPHRAVESGHDEPTDDGQDRVSEGGGAGGGDENGAGGVRASVERETTPNIQEEHEAEARESPSHEHGSTEERIGEREHALGDSELIEEVGQEEIVTKQVDNERDDRSVTPEATGQVQDEHAVHEDPPIDASVHEDPLAEANVPQGPPSDDNSMEAQQSDDHSHNNEAAHSLLGDNTHHDSAHDITMNNNSEDGRWNEAAEDLPDKENTHQQTGELHSGPTTPGDSAESSMIQAQQQQHHTEISASATERLTEEALSQSFWKGPSAATAPTTAATSAADSQQAQAHIDPNESSINMFSNLFPLPEQPRDPTRSPSPRVTRSSSRLRESSGASGRGGGGGESSATGAQESQSQGQPAPVIAPRRAGPMSFLQSLPHRLTSGMSQPQERPWPPLPPTAGNGQGPESQLPDGR